MRFEVNEGVALVVPNPKGRSALRTRYGTYEGPCADDSGKCFIYFYDTGQVELMERDELLRRGPQQEGGDYAWREPISGKGRPAEHTKALYDGDYLD